MWIQDGHSPVGLVFWVGERCHPGTDGIDVRCSSERTHREFSVGFSRLTESNDPGILDGLSRSYLKDHLPQDLVIING